MIGQWVIAYGIGLLMKRLSRWEKSINRTLVKKELAPTIRQAVPGDMFDDEIVIAFERLVDGFFDAVGETGTLEEVLLCLTRKQWNAAAEGIKAVTLKAWKPVSDTDKKLYAALQAYKPDFESLAVEATATEVA